MVKAISLIYYLAVNGEEQMGSCFSFGNESFSFLMPK